MFCNLSEFSVVDCLFDVHFLSLTQYPVNNVHCKHASSNTYEASDNPNLRQSSGPQRPSFHNPDHIMFKTLHPAKEGQ